jgi:hypothetical protein
MNPSNPTNHHPDAFIRHTQELAGGAVPSEANDWDVPPAHGPATSPQGYTPLSAAQLAELYTRHTHRHTNGAVPHPQAQDNLPSPHLHPVNPNTTTARGPQQKPSIDAAALLVHLLTSGQALPGGTEQPALPPDTSTPGSGNALAFYDNQQGHPTGYIPPHTRGDYRPNTRRSNPRPRRTVAAAIGLLCTLGIASGKGWTPEYVIGRITKTIQGDTTVPSLALPANCALQPVAQTNLESGADMLQLMNTYTRDDLARKKANPAFKPTAVAGYPANQMQILPQKFFAQGADVPPGPWVEGTPGTVNRYPRIQYIAKNLAILACLVTNKKTGNPITADVAGATVDRSKVALTIINNDPKNPQNILVGYERFPRTIQPGKEADSPFPPGELDRQAKVLSPTATKAGAAGGPFNPAIINTFKSQTFATINGANQCAQSLAVIVDESLRDILGKQASAQIGKPYSITFTGAYPPIIDPQLNLVAPPQRNTKEVQFANANRTVICNPHPYLNKIGK